MRYKITNCENKTTTYGDVKEITGIDVTGVQVTGSVWKKQKDGSDFPDFDKIVEGAEIELNSWVNPKTGKKSFYPPKLATGAYRASSGAKTAQIAKVMEQKSASIQKAQDFKSENIRVSSTMRDAVLIATTIYNGDKTDLSNMEELISKWRLWLWSHWEDTNNYPPFN